MGYIDEKVEILKDVSFDEYEYCPNGCNPILYGYLSNLIDKMDDEAMLGGTFLYYERIQEDRGILCFRNPYEDFHLILAHGSRIIKGKPVKYLSVKAMDGEYAWKLLNMIATSLHPLVEELDEFYLSKPKDYSDISVVDLVTRRTRRIIEPWREFSPSDFEEKKFY